jgi:hypothetical protein
MSSLLLIHDPGDLLCLQLKCEINITSSHVFTKACVFVKNELRLSLNFQKRIKYADIDNESPCTLVDAII